MELTKVVSWAVLSIAIPSMGCSSILGIEEKVLSSKNPDTCPLVTNALPAVRIMNAIPNSAALDVCHKASKERSYGKAWFAGRANQCGEGVAYTQYTRDLAIGAGTHDFKLVPAGAGCNATGVEITNVAIGADASVTLMAYGTTFDKAEISPLPNYVGSPDDQPVRFVHALNNAGLLTAGIYPVYDPTKLATPLYVDVEYGRSAAPTTGVPGIFDDIDPFGYNRQGGSSIAAPELKFGVRLENEEKIYLTAPIPLKAGHVYTVFALGTNGVMNPRPKVWSCDEREYQGAFLTCGNPQRLSVEIFNPNITDAFTSTVSERTGPAVEAILSGSSDLLCVTELYNPAVVEQLRNGSAASFENRVFSDDVPVERTTDLAATPAGTLPSYPPVACPGEYAEGLAQWLDCAKRSRCTKVDPATGESVLANPGDLAMACMFDCGSVGAPLQMIVGIQSGNDPEAGSCYWCGITHLASYESLEATLRHCTTEVPESRRSHMAFAGSSGLAVFSKGAVLGEPELIKLPSSGWQRAAMRVPVTLKNGSVFDYWCTSIRFPNQEEELSYAGPYGTWGTTGSAEEQAFEVATAASVIGERAQATGIPAIVGIVANAGPAYLAADGQTPVVSPLAPEIYSILSNEWSELVASDYEPACTFCGDAETNPLNSLGQEYRFWTTHLFGIGVPPSSVQSTKRTFMQRVIPLDGEGRIKAPVSQHFGLASEVMMTQ